jgi:hypothetical protein
MAIDSGQIFHGSDTFFGRGFVGGDCAGHLLGRGTSSAEGRTGWA